MRHVYSLREAALDNPSVVTIGVFDGVHRGHQHLLRQLVAHAKTADLVPVVLTFFPYPDTVLHGLHEGYYLTLPDAKAQLLGKLGVEIAVTHPFDEQVRHIRAKDFVGQLLHDLHMKSLWVGADFAMGYQREGNISFLTAEASRHDFELRVVDLMDAGGEHVSSSRIRAALREGHLEQAVNLLGHFHRVTGTVIEGAGRGHQIGIPTANLAVAVEQALPARGVYAAWAQESDQRHMAVVNIGLRPTFDSAESLTVEAHLMDFKKDLYGTTLALDFVKKLRDERKFDGIQALLRQIQRDIGEARTILAKSDNPPWITQNRVSTTD